MPPVHRRPSVVSFSGFQLDLDTFELSKNGRALHMRQQPARVLALLVQHGGEVVSRDEFRSQIWGEETFVDFEHGLNNCIKEIRSILGDNPSKPRYVETVPKRGYRFIATLDDLQKEDTVALVAPAHPANETDSKESRVSPTIWRPGWIIALSFVA